MDNEIENNDDSPTVEEAAREDILIEGPTLVMLYVSSLVGFCSPHSMKVLNKIDNGEVIMLINSNALPQLHSTEPCD